MRPSGDQARPDPGRVLDRRAFLTGVVGVTTGVFLAGCDDDTRPAARPTSPTHSHPTATSASPSPDPIEAGAMVVADRRRISGDVKAKAVEVRSGGVLEFDPDVSTTLTVTGNVIIRGVLEMRPTAAKIVHTLHFSDVDESIFVGDTMGTLETDVGLWVVDAGRLDLQGTPRQGWNRTGRHPSWKSDDEILLAPNAKEDYASYLPHRPGQPVPTVQGPNGVTYATEVFNLTRNVIIEGEPDGRSHVYVLSTSPQRVRHVLLQWLGPRRPAVDSNAMSEPVTGRYPLHFHHCGDGSRGTVVEGCVVKDSSRAFVPHASHGITMRDCVAFRILDDAFWWDERDETDDLTWEHCAVFDIRYDPEFRGKVAGFMLGLGDRLVIHDCVVVGAHGNGDDAGFQWPSFANLQSNNVWTASDLVAHNCLGDGVFVWQNDDSPHFVQRLVCYRNSQSGLQHGAYRNAFRYEDIVLFDNGDTDLRHQALPKDNPGLSQYQEWQRVWAPRMLISDHSAPTTRAVRFLDCTIDEITVDEWKSSGGTYEIHADVDPDKITVFEQKSTIKIIRPDGSSYLV